MVQNNVEVAAYVWIKFTDSFRSGASLASRNPDAADADAVAVA